MQKATPAIIRDGFRPSLSPRGAAARLPKKQPAWSIETMLAEKASFVDREASASPKSAWKGSSVMLVPVRARRQLESKTSEQRLFLTNKSQIVSKDDSAHRRNHGDEVHPEVVHLFGRRSAHGDRWVVSCRHD